MPTVRKVIPENIMPLGSIVTQEDYRRVKNCWIDRSGKLIYAGYWQHKETAQLLGFADIDEAESKGLIHISESSCNASGIPLFIYIPRKITDRQYDTLSVYCEAHKIQNPILVRGF